MKFAAQAAVSFADAKLETLRRNTNTRIEELQRIPAAAMTFRSVKIKDSTPTVVYHGLGRVPKFVGHGFPRRHDFAGVGVIVELDFIDPAATPRVPVNRAEFVVLWQDSFGGTIDLDVLFA